MLPHLSALDNLGETDQAGSGSLQQVVAVPPPLRFTHIEPPIYETRLRPKQYDRANGRTMAQRNGLRYEEKVQRHLQHEWGHDYLANPHLHFLDHSGWRTVISDGVLMRPRGVFVVVEIKYQHVADCWWQAHELYKPLLENHFGTGVACLEVCHTYDPSAPFPTQVEMIEDLPAWRTRDLAESHFGVFVWRG